MFKVIYFSCSQFYWNIKDIFSKDYTYRFPAKFSRELRIAKSKDTISSARTDYRNRRHHVRIFPRVPPNFVFIVFLPTLLGIIETFFAYPFASYIFRRYFYPRTRYRAIRAHVRAKNVKYARDRVRGNERG